MFHLLSGARHIFLYLNDMTDKTEQVVAPYVEAGLVTVIDWPGQFVQFAAHNDCLTRVRQHGEYKWVTMLDADEFMFTREVGGCIGDFLEGGKYDE